MTGWWVVAFVAQWVLVIALAIVVVALARQVGALHLRLGPRGALEIDTEGPALGEQLPELVARGPGGSAARLGGPGVPRLILFSSPTCSICREVEPGLPAAARAAGMVPVVIQDADVERTLEIPGTPFVLALDAVGVVRAKGTVNNLEQVEGLAETAWRRIEEEPWAS